jgi:hypothetical protein
MALIKDEKKDVYMQLQQHFTEQQLECLLYISTQACRAAYAKKILNESAPTVPSSIHSQKVRDNSHNFAQIRDI